VVCLIKDGYPWLNAFLEHHLALGVAHFVFVDNGSSDATIDFLRRRSSRVTVVRSTLPPSKYESYLRRQAIRKYARNHWCLCVDVDELFDYPLSDKMPLKGLLEYLERGGYNCVVSQMLDLFPDGPLDETHAGTVAALTSRYRNYDLSAIEARDYRDAGPDLEYFLRGNAIGSDAIKVLYGGVRKQFFGANVCLTKHPLVKVVPGVVPSVHPHAASGVRCADFTGLIRHYKFAGNFAERMRAQVRHKTWDVGDDELYLRSLERDPALSLVSSTTRVYSGLAALVSEGLLVASPALEAWAMRYA